MRLGAIISVTAIVYCLLAAQHSTNSIKSWAVSEVRTPASSGSGQPYLQVTPRRQILLSWVEPGGHAKHRLRFAEYGKSGWTRVQTVVEGDSLFVNWADVPSVVRLSSERLVAHWLNKSGSSTYAYDVLLKYSNDQGKLWSHPIKPHRDQTKTEHGFASLFELQDGRAAAVWLDGREMERKEDQGAAHEVEADMQLRFAALSNIGSLEEEVVLDSRVCECCPTAVARTDRTIIAAYRDRSEEEIRDIYVVRLVNGNWTSPQRVHEDGWQIPGCPVNGPALSARGKSVVLVWFTGAQSTPRVNAAFSDDEGASFGPSVRVDNGSPLGRVDVELLADGSALVSWVEWQEDGAKFNIRRVLANGQLGPPLKVADISAERVSGYPRMVTDDSVVYFAWTDVQEQKRVRFGTVALPPLLRQP